MKIKLSTNPPEHSPRLLGWLLICTVGGGLIGAWVNWARGENMGLGALIGVALGAGFCEFAARLVLAGARGRVS